jgi:hypothetical protein
MVKVWETGDVKYINCPNGEDHAPCHWRLAGDNSKFLTGGRLKFVISWGADVSRPMN